MLFEINYLKFEFIRLIQIEPYFYAQHVSLCCSDNSKILISFG